MKIGCLLVNKAPPSPGFRESHDSGFKGETSYPRYRPSTQANMFILRHLNANLAMAALRKVTFNLKVKGKPGGHIAICHVTV